MAAILKNGSDYAKLLSWTGYHTLINCYEHQKQYDTKEVLPPQVVPISGPQVTQNRPLKYIFTYKMRIAWWIALKLGRHMYLSNRYKSVAMVFSFHGNNAEITSFKRHAIFCGIVSSGINSFSTPLPSCDPWLPISDRRFWI